MVKLILMQLIPSTPWANDGMSSAQQTSKIYSCYLL
jgi:hypothetical protein